VRNRITVAETGVQALAAATDYRMFAEASGELGLVGSLQTGLAVNNLGASAATIVLTLFDLKGTGVRSGTLSVAANGQKALFLEAIPGFENLPKPVKGTLRITSNAPTAVVGLRARINERGEFLMATTRPLHPRRPQLQSFCYLI